MRGDVDWELFTSLSLRHGVMPLVYRRLKDSFAAAVPPSRMSFFAARYKQNVARNIYLTGEMLRALDALKGEGVEPIPYKGPALACEAYGDPALRQFIDLDILVRPRDVWKASAALERQGFEPHFKLRGESERAAFLRLGYVQLFTRPSDRLAVELHWGVAPRFFNFPFRIERLWESDQRLTVAGRSVRAIAPEFLVLLLCVHGNKDLWARLEWVSAIDALLSRAPRPNLETMLAEAKAHGALRVLLLGLALAHGLFETPLPPVALKQLGDAPAVSRLAEQVRDQMFADDPKAPTLAEQVRFHTRSKDGLRDRAVYCARLALTSTPVDWAATGLPASLSFARPFVRPLRLMKKYLLSPVRRAS
ncbi:MAG: nucleotidyltransferase family protein [Acidobacteria bacterium]|nr:nucleotidyltransferase family protein [Acidobacteriota bacterium]